MISANESRAITCFRGVAILFIVALHTTISHKFPDLAHGIDVDHFVSTIGSFSLLGLMIVSAYLFFQNSKGVDALAFARQKCHKRIKSLLLPYLIWSLISIGYSLAVGTPSKLGLHSFQDIAIFYLKGLWSVGGADGHPVGLGLWYVKSLMLMAVLSPLYLACYRLLGRWCYVLGIAAYAYGLTAIDNPWFVAAAFLSGKLAYDGYTLESVTRRFAAWKVLVPLLIGIFVFKHFNAWGVHLLGVGYFLSVFGLLVASDIRSETVGSIAAMSMFIYLSHFIIGSCFRNVVSLVGCSNIATFCMLYILSWAGTFVTALVVGLALKRLSPRLYAALVGGR